MRLSHCCSQQYLLIPFSPDIHQISPSMQRLLPIQYNLIVLKLTMRQLLIKRYFGGFLIAVPSSICWHRFLLLSTKHLPVSRNCSTFLLEFLKLNFIISLRQFIIIRYFGSLLFPEQYLLASFSSVIQQISSSIKRL